MSEVASAPRKSHLGLTILLSILLILTLFVYFFSPHYQLVDDDRIENTGRCSLYCFGILFSPAAERRTTTDVRAVDGYLPRFAFSPNEGWQLVKEKMADGHILSVYYYDTALRPGEKSDPLLFDYDFNRSEEFKGWERNSYGSVYACFPSILSAVANPEQMADWLLGRYKTIRFRED